MQVLYLHRLFALQQKAENHISIDFLPYTVQIKWLVSEMLKKFPKSPWTEKLVYRTLMRMRKADLIGKTERGGNEQPPVFPVDNDQTESGVESAAFAEDEPHNENEGE